MPVGFNNILGPHEAALNLQSHRSQLLGSNLANSDTPGYKAKDIDFNQALQTAQHETLSAGPLKMTRVAHIQPEGYLMGSELMFRIPTQVSLDGNTVESHVEMGQFAENSIRYLTSLRIVNGRLNKILTAFRGE